MFTDDLPELPPNPAMDNPEAMRRAIQVFHIMNEWANVYVPFIDGEVTAEHVIEKFNDELSVLGAAYKFEMIMYPEFLNALVDGWTDLRARLDEAEKEAK